MGDIFVGRKTLQPKREIIEYLAAEGIPTAPVYDSIDAALKDYGNKKILLRSEHPQDYGGSSDLLPGFILDEHLAEFHAEKITGEIFNNRETNGEKVRLHCRLLGLDYENFISEFSHSAWEDLPGTNRSIFADSAIEGRYHIFTLDPRTYTIISKDDVLEFPFNKIGHSDIPEGERHDLISLYESIRDVLDKDHCYSVEVQSIWNSDREREQLALQVHRGVDFSQADFVLDEQLYGGEMELRQVRGATKENGEDLKLTIEYPRNFENRPLLVDENASLEANRNYVSPVFSEIMFRRRKLHLVRDSDHSPFYKELDHHNSRSSFFKPVNSAILPGPKWVDYLSKYTDVSRLTSGKLEQINIHFVSDGNRAYLKFID